MLDLYFTEGQTNTIPEEPDENRYLGSIDLHQYTSLEELLDICTLKEIYLPYFEDSFIQHVHVKEMLNIFKEHSHLVKGDKVRSEAYGLLVDILSDAVKKDAGLVSFCD